ncbi:unnamed protein product [Spodoptera exigua]|nr:unnamed protein product [Spodoptera exigua]
MLNQNLMLVLFKNSSNAPPNNCSRVNKTNDWDLNARLVYCHTSLANVGQNTKYFWQQSEQQGHVPSKGKSGLFIYCMEINKFFLSQPTQPPIKKKIQSRYIFWVSLYGNAHHSVGS